MENSNRPEDNRLGRDFGFCMEFLARVTGRCHAATTYRPILAHARPNVTLHSVPKSLTLPASPSHFFLVPFQSIQVDCGVDNFLSSIDVDL